MEADYGNYNQFFLEENDFSAIQELLNRATGGSNTFHFEEFIRQIISGELPFNFETVVELLRAAAFGNLSSNASDILSIITIAVIAAVFANFSFAFRGSHVADTAFYVTYLILYGILATTYYQAFQIAQDTISNVAEFMKLLVPSYCIAIVCGSGTMTSVYWYEATLVLITVTEFVLLRMIMPVISMYMMVSLASNLSREDVLSKFVELLDTLIRWALKTMLAVVIGIGTIQGMVTPAVDQLRRSSAVKAASSIPGIGNLFGGVAETMLGAGVLLKNAVGTAGVVALVMICMIPVLLLAIYSLLYRAGAAVIQPVSDKRIVQCMSASATASGMLMRAVLTSALLFIIAITLVAHTTL